MSKLNKRGHIKIQTKIKYLIYSKYLASQKYTFFSNYYEVDIKFMNIISKVLSLPKDLLEIYASKEGIIKNRFSGWFPGYDIDFISDPNKLICEDKICVYIIFEISDIDFINSVVDKNCIFISDNLHTDEDNNIYNFNNLDNCKIKDIFENFLVDNELKLLSDCKKSVESVEDGYTSNDKVCIEGTLYKHLYAQANLNTLKSIRCSFKEERINVISEVDIERPAFYINKIRHDADKIVGSGIQRIGCFDYILTDLSYNQDFVLNKKDYTKRQLLQKGYTEPDEVIEALKFIRGSDLNLEIGLENQYISQYINEKLLVEELISIKSASFVSPTIKLKLNSNSYASLLKEIGSATRDTTKKLNSSFLKIEKKLKDDIKDNFDYFGKSSFRLKLVSNLPIEWASDNGLPLMVKHEVSRIPVSPGFISKELLLDNDILTLTHESLKKILVITSFCDDDPIKNHMKDSIDIANKDRENDMEEFARKVLDENNITFEDSSSSQKKIDISVELVSVSNKDELIEALNSFNYAITIFDLHGSHIENKFGCIHLKDETVSMYSLSGQVKVSPIVILSSCDTSPYDRNHYNTTNSFLLLGAKTVLSSAVPIKSYESSAFVARLVLRLKVFLYVQLFTIKKSIHWSSIVTGMIRMSYFTELIFKLRDKLMLEQDTVNELLFFTNININPLMNDAFNNIKKEICKKCNLRNGEYDSFINQNFKFPECLKYIQIGNPDLITFVSEDEIGT